MGEGGQVDFFFHSDSKLLPAVHQFCESEAGND